MSQRSIMSDRIRKRMAWIEACLRRHGRFRKEEYVAAFGVSAPQVSLDLKAYCALANERGGDLRQSYGKIEGELPPVPIFGAPSILNWLDGLGDADLYTDVAKSVRLPPDDAIYAAVQRGIETPHALKVEYHSLSSGPSTKVLSCHHLVMAVGRLHVRAFDHGRSRYADFVLGRMESASRNVNVSYLGPEYDKEWHEFVDLPFRTSHQLPTSRRSAVELEYGLAPGETGSIRVRKALRFYAALALGIFPTHYAPPLELELALDTEIWPHE